MEFIKLLYKSKPAYRKVLLEGATPEIINLLSKCAFNILHGKILISENHKNKLKKHKSSLRKLACPKISTKQKKKILQKGGGFLLPLLAPAVGSLLGIIVDKIAKKIINKKN